MIDLVFYNKTKDKKWKKYFFNKFLSAAVLEKELYLDKKITYGLSIHLVGEAKIKSLNKKYRNKNKATDVLSFPLNNSKISKKYKYYDTIDLGDIFISLPVAKKESKLSKISVKHQLMVLVIHGFLHLFGYDHEKSEKENKKMFYLQNKILKNIISIN